MRKPEAAQAPAPASFPEAERMLPGAAMQYPPAGSLLRTYVLEEGWTEVPDGSGRNVEVLMYYREKGGALVKDERGGQDSVCFRYPCLLAQKHVGAGYAPPVLECNAAMAAKVTCGSVDALPDGVAMR
jgi:hypothetical protein